ncbi:MAG TPA: aconitate hydratase [Micromonosporaceae bacterium]|nr:aconitate hydratase [Micromonosporaceae bacterium]HCU48574.1 aconitate hydratase [Micromonosporaceae bacterium]
MGLSAAQKLISSRLVSGEMTPGTEIGLRVDQTLTQDATGTMVMLELEALNLGRVQTFSVQYVDHNLLQADERNMADHLFLRSACRRFGIHYCGPGNGVSHPVHMERFGKPGLTLIGSDSHTCAAGCLGMLAIGVGGLEVAAAMAGEPLYVTMPQIWGVRLSGALKPWVSAKDVILELLRRHGVGGGVNRIVEYHGPGLAGLSAMDRHVIANMGAELGATASVFPADEQVREFMQGQGREADFTQLRADPDAAYDVTDEIDLSTVEPLIAAPGSPGNVIRVSQAGDVPVGQVVVGSSANPGLRDFAMVAAILRGRQASPQVSLDINPTSRQVLADLTAMGATLELVKAGARIHQAGCLGCIGMGQAPAVGVNSLRTFPRNFPGRSGTSDDLVWLCSPETAAAAALTGSITDPRDLPSLLGISYPALGLPGRHSLFSGPVEQPLPAEQARTVALVKAPSIGKLPDFDPLPDTLTGPVLLKVGNDISTDEIMPAGARALPYRSNIEKLADFAFIQIDPSYPERARDTGTHVVIGGSNYGQGSSREHAAIVPRYLGLRLVIAKSYARIHWQNLANFGVLALEFTDPADYDTIFAGDQLTIANVRESLQNGQITLRNLSRDTVCHLHHRFTPRQISAILAGGRIPLLRAAKRET